MVERSRRLVLRYRPGQFSFRHFSHSANPTQLYQLANALNSFQEDEAEQIVLVRVLQF